MCSPGTSASHAAHAAGPSTPKKKTASKATAAAATATTGAAMHPDYINLTPAEEQLAMLMLIYFANEDVDGGKGSASTATPAASPQGSKASGTKTGFSIDFVELHSDTRAASEDDVRQEWTRLSGTLATLDYKYGKADNLVFASLGDHEVDTRLGKAIVKQMAFSESFKPNYGGMLVDLNKEPSKRVNLANCWSRLKNKFGVVSKQRTPKAKKRVDVAGKAYGHADDTDVDADADGDADADAPEPTTPVSKGKGKGKAVTSVSASKQRGKAVTNGADAMDSPSSASKKRRAGSSRAAKGKAVATAGDAGDDAGTAVGEGDMEVTLDDTAATEAAMSSKTTLDGDAIAADSQTDAETKNDTISEGIAKADDARIEDQDAGGASQHEVDANGTNGTGTQDVATDASQASETSAAAATLVDTDTANTTLDSSSSPTKANPVDSSDLSLTNEHTLAAPSTPIKQTRSPKKATPSTTAKATGKGKAKATTTDDAGPAGLDGAADTAADGASKFTTADTELLRAVIIQITSATGPGGSDDTSKAKDGKKQPAGQQGPSSSIKIDMEKLAADLGIAKKETASKRWSRFRQKVSAAGIKDAAGKDGDADNDAGDDNDDDAGSGADHDAAVSAKRKKKSSAAAQALTLTEDDKDLVLAIINQLTSGEGSSIALNFDRLARDMSNDANGPLTRAAASKRWSRFLQKLRAGKGLTTPNAKVSTGPASASSAGKKMATTSGSKRKSIGDAANVTPTKKPKSVSGKKGSATAVAVAADADADAAVDADGATDANAAGDAIDAAGSTTALTAGHAADETSPDVMQLEGPFEIDDGAGPAGVDDVLQHMDDFVDEV